MKAAVTPGERPPNLYFDMTGEAFEFQTSAKTGDGMFRFQWTLQGGKKGPPEHVHDGESETFAIVSGTLRIWLDGTPQDLGPGQAVTVKPGVGHRFLNPTKEPVVVDVSLDGPLQEDALVPLAVHCAGRRKMKLRDVFVMIVHAGEVNASRPPSKVGRAIFTGIGRLIRLFGVRPLARYPGGMERCSARPCRLRRCVAAHHD
jgi:mannose-6-phosphate isomerase-like protein (cupin superfamily)